MEEKLKFYFQDVLLSDAGASDGAVAKLHEQLGFELPPEYISFMKEFNGGEGGVGPVGWLELYPVEDLIPANQDYHRLMEDIPDYFLFGKDAADTGYAFHKFNKTFHAFGLMSNFETDSIEFCGNDFLEFLEYLYRQKSFY